MYRILDEEGEYGSLADAMIAGLFRANNRHCRAHIYAGDKYICTIDVEE